MEKLRGCLHVNEDLSLTGGAEKMVRQIGLELSRRGLEVGLVSTHEFRDHTGLKEYVIPSFNRHYALEYIPELAQTVINIMNIQGYDLLHAYSVTNNELLREIAKTKPVLKSVYDSRSFCPTENRLKVRGDICTESVGINCIDCMEEFGIPGEVKKRLAQTMSGLATMDSYKFVFTPSEYVRRQLMLNNIFPDKIKVLPFF